MIRKLLSIFLIVGVLMVTVNPSYNSAAATLPGSLVYKWTSPKLNVYSWNVPINIDETGNVRMKYQDKTSNYTAIIINSKGKVTFKYKGDIDDFIRVKDGVVISEGNIVKKVNNSGKTIWSKKVAPTPLTTKSLTLSKSGKLYAYTSFSEYDSFTDEDGKPMPRHDVAIYNLNPKNGKTIWSKKLNNYTKAIKFNPSKSIFYVLNQKGYMDAIKENKKIWSKRIPKEYYNTSIADISSNGTIALIHEKFKSTQELIQIYSSSGQFIWQRTFKEGIKTSLFNDKENLLVTDGGGDRYYLFDPKGNNTSAFTKYDNSFSGTYVFHLNNSSEIYTYTYNSKGKCTVRKLDSKGKVINTSVINTYHKFITENGAIGITKLKGKDRKLNFYRFK